MSAAPDSTPSVFAQWAARQTNGPYGTSLPRAALPGENLNPISGMPVPTTPSPQSNSVFAQWADKQQMQKMGQYQEQQVQAHAPGGLKGYLNAAAKSAVGPMENLFSRLHNHFVSEVTGNELVNMDRTGPADPAFAQAQVRTQQDIDQNRTNLNAMLPTNPANWGTKLGNIHGAVAGPMLASTLMPGAMVPVMVAQGAENRTETVENNPNLSALQKAAYVGGGMIWDAVLGKMVPAGPLAATASRGIFPATGRALVQGAIGAGEGAGYVAGETALARATGADPNRPWIDPTQTATMGIMRGATSVAGEAAHPNPFTEARARVEELKAQEAKPAEAENAKPAVPAGPLARAAEVRPPETPQGKPNFAAAAFENPAGEVQPPVEAKPETPEGPKAAPEVPPEFAGAKFLTPKEARTPDRPPTTLGELLKGNPAIRNLSEETLRTPVYFSTRLRGAHGDAKGVERSLGETNPRVRIASHLPDDLIPAIAAHEAAHVERGVRGRPLSPPVGDEWNLPEERSARRLEDFAGGSGYMQRIEDFEDAEQHLQELPAKLAAHEFQPRRTEENPVPPEGTPERRAEMQQAAEQQRIQDAILEKNPLAQARENQTAKTGEMKPGVPPQEEMQHGVLSPEEIRLSTPEAKAPAPENETFFQKVAREGGEKIARLAKEEVGAFGSGPKTPPPFAAPTNLGFENLRAQGEATRGQQPLNPTKLGPPVPPAKTSALTGPGSIWHEEVHPALMKFSKFAYDAKEFVKTLFPMETGTGSRETANIFRAKQAEGRLAVAKAHAALDDLRGAFDKMPLEENLAFQQRMYDREVQPTPELQKVSDALYALKNNERKAIAATGKTGAIGWDRQKWNMCWKKGSEHDLLMFRHLLSRGAGPGKVEGPANILKPKTLEEFSQGVEKGLVPLFSNPIEQAQHTYQESVKYRMGVEGLRETARATGIRRTGTPNGGIPEGWSEIPQGAKSPFMDVLEDLVPGKGAIIAPNEVNRVLDNITTPSLLSKGFPGSVAKFAQGFNNQATQILLGLSNFHVKKVAIENAVLQNARALDLLKTGDRAKALEASTRALDPISVITRGAKIQKQHLGLLDATPDEAKVLAAQIQGGMSATHDPAYNTNFRRKLANAVNQGGIQGMLRAAVYSPFAANEAFGAHGVFAYVQHAKLSIGYDMASDWLQQHPDATTSEIRDGVGKISDHLDNVLGLMERDNLFWNRTARDLATLATMSVGWNYGSARATAGGAIDLGHGVRDLERAWHRGNFKETLNNIDTRRISYLASMAASTAITGAIGTYLATGKGPQELKDYIFTKSGDKDREGHDVRYGVGFYSSDIYDFIAHPVNTLGAKASPLIHTVSALYANQDAEHRKIYDTANPNDTTFGKVALDIGKFLVRANGVPINIQQMERAVEGGGSASQSLNERYLLPAMGIKRAPANISYSPAEEALHNIVASVPHTVTKTKASEEAFREVENLAQDKSSDLDAKIQEHLKSGTLTPKDIHSALREANGPKGLLKVLNNAGADVRSVMQHVWPKMDVDEQSSARFLLLRKIKDADIPAEEKQRYFKIVNP